MRRRWCGRCRPLFFFKQKTAYEIGLGIPAEPLFRSAYTQGKPLNCSRLPCVYAQETLTFLLTRSEERRVGKECRSRRPTAAPKRDARRRKNAESACAWIRACARDRAPECIPSASYIP